MTRNVELLLKVAADFEADLDKWDQYVWFTRYGPGCQTHACIAGDAIMLSLTADQLEEAMGETHMLIKACELLGFDIEEAFDENHLTAVHGADGQLFVHAARVLLGLTEAEAEELFDHHWMPVDDVPSSLRALAAGASVESVTWQSPLSNEYSRA